MDNINTSKILTSPSNVHNLSAESLVIKMVSEGKCKGRGVKDIGETKLQKKKTQLIKEEIPMTQETPMLERIMNIPSKDRLLEMHLIKQELNVN